MQLSRAATAAAVAPAEPSAPLSPAPAPAPAPPGPLPHSAADGAPAGGQGGPGRREEPQCAQLAAASGPSPGAGMDGPGASAVVVRVGIPDLQQTVSFAARVPAAPLPSSASPPPARWEPGAGDPRPAATHPSPAASAGTLPLPPGGGGAGEAPPLGRGLAGWTRRRRGRGPRRRARDSGGAGGFGAPRGAGGPAPAHESAPPQKCLRLDPAAPVWAAKQRVLCALNHSLQDALNYGLFQPPSRGRAGKFLDEERLLQEYPPNLDTPLPYLEVSGGRGRRSARGTPRRARGPERWRARQRGARRVGAGELVCERGGGCRAPGAVCRVRGVSRVRCARPAARAVGCEQA